MNVITLINLLCSDYAGPSHNGNGSNNDDAIGEGDGLGLSASNSFVEADDDESVSSVFEFIGHPNGDDDSIQEYMHWHYRLNHASFPTMLHMAKQKHLPQGISTILRRMERQRHKPPLCSDCIASKMCRKQWRQKQEKEREIKPRTELLPGDVVSVDHIHD